MGLLKTFREGKTAIEEAAIKAEIEQAAIKEEMAPETQQPRPPLTSAPPISETSVQITPLKDKAQITGKTYLIKLKQQFDDNGDNFDIKRRGNIRGVGRIGQGRDAVTFTVSNLQSKPDGISYDLRVNGTKEAAIKKGFRLQCEAAGEEATVLVRPESGSKENIQIALKVIKDLRGEGLNIRSVLPQTSEAKSTVDDDASKTQPPGSPRLLRL